MNDRTAYAIAAQYISPADFSYESHRMIWKSLKVLFESNMPTSPDMVSSVLERNKSLGLAGGDEYIAALYLTTAPLADISGYAQEIQAHSTIRKIRNAGENIKTISYETLEPSVMHAKAVHEIVSVSAGARLGLRTLSEVITDMSAGLEARWENPSDVVGLRTGFPHLDLMTGGQRKGFLYLIAASPAMGKTHFMLSVCYYQALLGKRICIFSIEMKAQELAARLIAYHSGIRSLDIQRGMTSDVECGILRKFTPGEIVRIREAKDFVANLPIRIDDHPAPTTSDIRVSLSNTILQYGADAVWIDYLNLMDTADINSRQQSMRVHELEMIARNLKVLSEDLDIPVGATAQLSRKADEAANKRPEMSFIKDSGGIEAAADQILLPFREDQAKRTLPGWKKNYKVNIFVDKDRTGGMTGEVDAYYHPRTGLFSETKVPE